MAAINFYGDDAGDFDVTLAGSSGVGFYGAGNFGASIAVGAWNENTYITDPNGALEGPKINNVKWTHALSGELPVSDNLQLQDIANASTTLNVRFTHGSAVQIQNAELRIYDRIAPPDAGASGVTTKAYETLHPSPVQTGLEGSGAQQWTTPVGSDTTLSLADSPGESGGYAGAGSESVRPDTRHDWYVCLSARPDSIGSKTQYGLYVSLEYL